MTCASRFGPMMNYVRRGLIFSTFLGCSLSAALLAASLSTDHWVHADAKRATNPYDSAGSVFLGLFNGRRELNVGYGWRTYAVSMTQLLNGEPELMHFGLWITTVASISAAIVFALIGALSAIVNTTVTPVEAIAGRLGLFIWNGLSVVFALTAVTTWIVQFYKKLANNVLIQEDRDNHWTTEGRAAMGYSFWFVIGSAFSHICNILLLSAVDFSERKKKAKQLPTEKNNSAVLLY